jgi:hypothetical protein
LPHPGTPSAYRLEAVDEPSPPREVDSLGALLAHNLTWVEFFLAFLSSIPINSPPSLTVGSEAFIRSCNDESAGKVVRLLDELYRDIRDGYQLSEMQGDILERFVWHLLAERFPDRLGACRLLIDGAPGQPDFEFDAATRPDPCGVGLEAKNSERSLNPHPARRSGMREKASWVLGMRDRTESHLAGVFVTWATEENFRAMVAELVGRALGRTAVVYGRESLTRIPTALTSLERDLRTSSSRP